jgi:pimeloyl-ACP methyl ester carboxylesterase
MTQWSNNGKVIGYSVEGNGPPILAFHGTTQASNAWDAVRLAMTQSRTWITSEFPGSGESSMPTGPIDLDETVNDAVALMEHLGHSEFHVVGYSLGAVAALRTAALHTQRVRTVTSLCGWAQSDARMRMTFELWRRLIALDPKLFMHYAIVDGSTVEAIAELEPIFQMALDMASAAIAPGSDAHLELDLRVDISESLPEISAPALVIGGVQDRWVDVAQSRHIAAHISGSQLVEIDAGHLVINERATDLAALIQQHTAV